MDMGPKVIYVSGIMNHSISARLKRNRPSITAMCSTNSSAKLK